MKVSVSLPLEDVQFLDAYAEAQGVESRSAVVHRAVRLLRASALGSQYEDAWSEWAASGDEGVWVRALGDGVTG